MVEAMEGVARRAFNGRSNRAETILPKGAMNCP